MTDICSIYYFTVPYVKKSRYIIVNFDITESKWRNKSKEFIKQNFCDGDTKCFYRMVEQAEKNGDLIDKQGRAENNFYATVSIFSNLLEKSPEFRV